MYGIDPITYLNYYNGQEAFVSDSEYQTRFGHFDFYGFLRDLFPSTDVLITEVKNPLREKEIIFKITGNVLKNTIFLTFFKIKNSGMPNVSRKRLQVFRNYFGYRNIDNAFRDEDDTYFFIGYYPIDSIGNFVFALFDNDGVSLAPKAAYSSLWIDYEVIRQTAITGIYFAMNKRNFNKYLCFTKRYFSLVTDALLNDDFSSIISNGGALNFLDDRGEESEFIFEDIVVEDYVPSRDAVVTREGRAKIKKNSALRDVILFDANYTCALCEKKETFITNNDRMYFEAHHLIPCNINNQVQFVKKLDHIVNLYCLCPECHRKIHYIQITEVEELLEKLYLQKEELLFRNYNLTLDHLVSIYQGIDRRNEEEM